MISSDWGSHGRTARFLSRFRSHASSQPGRIDNFGIVTGFGRLSIGVATVINPQITLSLRRRRSSAIFGSAFFGFRTLLGFGFWGWLSAFQAVLGATGQQSLPCRPSHAG